MAERGVPLHLMATFLLLKKQQIQGEGGRLRTSHQRSCVLQMVLFETQTSNADFYGFQIFEQISLKNQKMVNFLYTCFSSFQFGNVM